MNKHCLRRFAFKLALLALLALPGLANAQYFTDTESGDVVAGFRKTGAYEEASEMVAYLGNITNFLQVPAGTSINITNYQTKQLTNMCPDGLGNLQWSVFSSFDGDNLPTALGTFPGATCWLTLARTNVNVQSKSFSRSFVTTEPLLSARIVGVSDGANELASGNLGATNAYDNTLVLLEPYSYSATMDLLDDFIGDRLNNALGDFYGSCISFSVENVTSNNFTSAAISDFYQDCPASSASEGTYIDPITGLTNGTCYYVGYFTLNTNGSMVFTRAAAVTAPSSGSITSSATNGFSPLTVTFTNTASGSITNWVWNFGNGTIITNTTGGNVTYTYTTGGTYTVTLTVYGPGGSTTVTFSNAIVASPKPKVMVASVAGKFVLSGTNCPAGVEYRVLNSTNLALAVTNWTAVSTNYFLSNGKFAYTNAMTNVTGFFRLVSP